MVSVRLFVIVYVLVPQECVYVPLRAHRVSAGHPSPADCSLLGRWSRRQTHSESCSSVLPPLLAWAL